MLDDIFRYMSQDNYAHWIVHCRLKSNPIDMTINIPHSFSDGRRIVRNISPLFFEIGSRQKKYWRRTNIIDSVDLTKFSFKNITRFQTILKKLIDELKLVGTDTIAIAVDISEFPIQIKNNFGNQIAFPIFSLNELKEYLSLDKVSWKRLLLEKAETENANYEKFASLLPKLSQPKRMRLYDKLPINSVTAVISYFGNLGRFVDTDIQNLLALDFAVSTTKGPNNILVGYSVDEETVFHSTKSGDPFNWNSNQFRFRIKETNIENNL